MQINTLNTLNTPYNKMLKFADNVMSDYEASYQLGHTEKDESALICQKDGLDLFLFGCVTIMTPEGRFLVGRDILSILAEVNVTSSQIQSFLDGEYNASLIHYSVMSNPWFEWQERDGETNGAVLHEIPSDIDLLHLT
jgi:hypothetical protein